MDLLNWERLRPSRAAALGILIVCGLAAPSGQPITTTLAVPGRANAHVALASDGAFVVAVWAASLPSGPTDIFAAVSRDGAATFGSPVRANSSPGDARVNGEQPPRVALASRLSRDPEIAVIWTAKGSSGTTLLTARSMDGGRTFEPSALLPGTDAPGNRGWEAIATTAGRVHALWLDHRELAHREPSGTSSHTHAGHATSTSAIATTDGVAMAAHSKLYVATLGGPGLPRPIAASVCYCCKTALATSSNGGIFAAWRHVYPGNIRDIAFAMSRDGARSFSDPVRVSEDRWQLNGCPDDGPAMAVDGRQRIHVVWPTMLAERDGPTMVIYHAMSEDGRAFGARARLPTEGVAHHPQLAVSGDGSLSVVWDESGQGPRRIAFAHGRVDPAGGARFQRQVLTGTALGVYPVVVTAADKVVLAWTAPVGDNSVIRLSRR